MKYFFLFLFMSIVYLGLMHIPQVGPDAVKILLLVHICIALMRIQEKIEEED